MKISKHTILIIIFIHAIGCSSWRMVPKKEFGELNSDKSTIQVKLVDGSLYETQNYIFRSDSLIIVTLKTPFYKGSKISIPLEKIFSIKKQETDQVNVSLLVVMTVTLIYLLHETGKGYSGVF